MKRLVLLLLLTAPLAAEPRRFIVEFNAELSAAPPSARMARALRFRTEAAEVATVRREFTRAFHGAAVELREGQTVESLAHLPFVSAVYPDGEVVAYDADGTPRSASRRDVRANAGGSGIVVAVIDSGIDYTHPALAGKVIGGYDFVNDDDDAMDDHQHGTHVAGIIAAQSPEKTGVAPNVKLLAYKVLNHQGRGLNSDVIAAIERAIDPNGDGDLSDRADVLNLSLGGPGHGADPVSQAVNNAVSAGAVVCVASGNEETFHRIGSPAGAANAITVGASTIDEDGLPSLAYFTSRGPANQTGAIKPDLLAPGRDIHSTGLHHGYVTLSGTSMATPYAAGLAALLREQHPDWTPERVKSALVGTAIPVAVEEVMSQGTGIASLARARTNTLVASPTQVNFGLNGVTSASWSSARTVTVTNDSNIARTIHATVEGATAAISIAVTPQELTLGAGESGVLEFAVTVDNTTLGDPPSWSFSFGGLVTLDSGAEQLKLPWAFVRAGRVTMSSAGLANALWLSDEPRKASPVNLGGGAIEVLLEPAVYDLALIDVQNGELRLLFAEQQPVAGDLALTWTPGSTPHEIRFAGSDDAGTPFPDGNGTTTRRGVQGRLLLPDGRTLGLPDTTARAMYTSSFTERFGVLLTESYVDAAAARVFLAQYPAQRGVSSDRVLQVSPGDYASQEVELHFPTTPIARREVGIMVRDWPKRTDEHRLAPPVLRFPVEGASWTGTLYMTPEVSGEVASGVHVQLYTDENADFPATLTTPMIRRGGEGFFGAWGFTLPPLPVRSYAGEKMSFGRGAIHLPGQFHGGVAGIAGDIEVIGPRGDRRRTDTTTGRIRVFASNGAQVGESGVTFGSSFFVPLQTPGRYTTEVRIGPFPIDDRIGEATQRTTLDTTHGSSSPPMVTSFAVLDGAGRHVTRLAANGNGSLVFSAADHEQMLYRRIADSATQVFFRRRGANTWVELDAVATGEEESADDLARQPVGLVYRVDLQDALRLGAGEYEIAIGIADEQGNTTQWQLTPAFIVESAGPMPRRRAAGK